MYPGLQETVKINYHSKCFISVRLKWLPRGNTQNSITDRWLIQLPVLPPSPTACTWDRGWISTYTSRSQSPLASECNTSHSAVLPPPPRHHQIWMLLGPALVLQRNKQPKKSKGKKRFAPYQSLQEGWVGDCFVPSLWKKNPRTFKQSHKYFLLLRPIIFLMNNLSNSFEKTTYFDRTTVILLEN